jgi:hypothetical protein
MPLKTDRWLAVDDNDVQLPDSPGFDTRPEALAWELGFYLHEYMLQQFPGGLLPGNVPINAETFRAVCYKCGERATDVKAILRGDDPVP